MNKLRKYVFLVSLMVFGAFNSFGLDTNPPNKIAPLPTLEMRVQPHNPDEPILYKKIIIDNHGGDDKLTQRSFANLESQMMEMAQEEIALQNAEASEEEFYTDEAPVYAKFMAKIGKKNYSEKIRKLKIDKVIFKLSLTILDY